MTRPTVLYDVSRLPTFAYGARNPLWWGNLAFMVIEGLGFLFPIAAYLYFYNHNQSWPLGAQSGLFWPSLLTALLILSEIPNMWLKKAAKKHDLGRVRIGLIVMLLLGIGAIVLRGFEFTTVHVRWDDNAYGSIVWYLLGLHTAHIVTDVCETLVLTVLMHIGPVDMRRFPDIEDNQDYCHFIIIWWLIIYVVIYWLPRWFEVAP